MGARHARSGSNEPGRGSEGASGGSGGAGPIGGGGAASPVRVVDQSTGFNAAAGVDTVDGVHPNDSGSQKIADKWYTALFPWF